MKGGSRPQGGPAPFSQALDEAQDHGRARETIRLFGQQELDEISLITADGRVFAGDEPLPPFQEPGTALLRARSNGHNELDEDGNRGAGDPDGSGTAHVRLTIDPPELCVRLRVRNIGLPAAAAHIHEGTADVSGPVVISLPVPDGDGRAQDCVTEGVTSELLAEIAADPAGYYVNVHNATFPAGAVRGQLEQDPRAVIPSPGDRFVYRERLFDLDRSDPDRPRPRGEQLGTLVAECTLVTAGQEPQDISYLRSRMFMFDSRGDIALAEAYTFADPLPDTIPVTGGSGRYRDAGGQVVYDFSPIEGDDDVPFSNSVYEIQLLHLR